MRVAFSRIASKTGSRLPGERTDDLEHVGGGGLLLERFAQLAEKPRVLEGDDGLRGEVLHQLDLLVGKRPYFLTIDGNGAYKRALLEHRHDEKSAGAGNIGETNYRWIAFKVRRLLPNIVDVR